jgi:GSCFA family
MAAKVGQLLAADEAFDNIIRNREPCLWPTSDSARLEPFYRPALSPRFRLKPRSSIFTIGSCFARNIEEHLAPLGFDVPMAAFGVPEQEWPARPFARRAGILNKYTPPSMLQEVVQARALIVLETGNRAKQILLTVSPVPLTATFSGMDVVMANAYGKSGLRAVAQLIYDEFEEVDYFPSYEMVALSKEGGTWENDLMHVTDAFVRRIVDAFIVNYVET